MNGFLMATKLQIPPPRRRVVWRGRLVDALDRDVPRFKLVLISAPAGYGKTTLLSQWAHASRCPVAWLSIGAEDDGLDHFLRGLAAAWQKIQPDIAASRLGVLLGGMAPDREAVLPAFIDAAQDAADPVVFVLDDFHLIEAPAVHQALAFLIDHLPPKLHFVLSSRGEPPLPLARYRARHELAEFRAEDLGFSLEESTAFLNDVMGLELAQAPVSKLQSQLEGWIAGLQLVALTLEKRLTGADNLVVSGRHRFVADYLSEDVLAPLPPTTRSFLLQTSVLERMCGSLCEAVTGETGGQALLETLEQEALFLVALDDHREWFRYHRLFADFLRGELQRRCPDQIAELHRRAARWHLAHDLPEPAFRHAVDGQDVELVVRILERYVQAKLMGGEFKSVQQWLDAIPEAWGSDHPIIGLVRGGLLLFTGQIDACIHCVEDIEQRLLAVAAEDAGPQLAQVNAIRCSVACFQDDMARAEYYADQAVQDLRDGDRFFRGIIYGSLGDTYRRYGQWAKAKDCYLELLDFIHGPTFRLQSAHVYGALADLYLRQGHLREADGYWKKALAAIEDRQNWGRLPLPLTGWVYIRSAELLYEWNELADAWAHLSRGLERAELAGDVRAMIAGYLIAGRLKLTRGEAGEAAAYLERARPLVEQAPFSHWISRFERFQLELWLAQDRLRAAVHWSDRMLEGDTLASRPESETAQLAVARVLILKGDASSVQQGLAHLAHLAAAAQAQERIGVQIEGLALQALAYWRRRQVAEAMSPLERALRLAEPEGYVRRFADLGLPMARLLQEARARDVMPDYVETLLAAFGGGVSLPGTTQEPLPEPLTQREEEVLELLAAGLTNREIAQALVISPGTVKKHAGNIYGKLGVGGRTQAAARARELGLLD
jgi:LuxR family maltose regulon positive regulatory protein